jgi:hypothetical protein
VLLFDEFLFDQFRLDIFKLLWLSGLFLLFQRALKYWGIDSTFSLLDNSLSFASSSRSPPWMSPASSAPDPFLTCLATLELSERAGRGGGHDLVSPSAVLAPNTWSIVVFSRSVVIRSILTKTSKLRHW